MALTFDEYSSHDALGLAELVRTGQTTAAELLEAALARLAEVDGTINSVVHRHEEWASKRAAATLSGPFAGVPFLLKNLHQPIAGWPDDSGSRALRGHIAPATSPVVARWLDAGLVPFGQTNSPEFGSKGVTEPQLHGPTRNPWDLDRSPGGSSGGSAAAVAAGIVPAAGASDGGGSIRIPASWAGLFGLKPGRGLVPEAPLAAETFHGYATQGVLSRSVRDSAALLDAVIAAEPSGSYLSATPQRPLLQEVGADPGKLRIGFGHRSPLRPEGASPEAVAAVAATAKLAASLGHHVEEAEPDIDWTELAEDFLTLWFSNAAFNLAELSRLGFDVSQVEVDNRILAALGAGIKAVDLHRARQRWHEQTVALTKFFDRYDLFLTPTAAEAPPKIGSLDTPAPLAALSARVLDLRGGRVLAATGVPRKVIMTNYRTVPYTQLANVTGRPAMSVPLHWTADGLPIGSQFVGPLGSEPLLIRLAAQLEEAQPWKDRRPPV
ncbi:MAG: amidase [Segniliparus sp.]|uniref:amidase n=1 Tax=Segniliparus sp. TaxID=2804064 RepID=UPI003F4068EA